MKDETQQTGECEGIESPRRDLYTLYSRNPSWISPRSLLALSAEARGGVGRRERRDSTMRARIARHCHPPHSSLIPSPSPWYTLRRRVFRSHRNLGGPSLFLASRACENSSMQDAIGVERRGRWRCSGNVVPRELFEINDVFGKRSAKFLPPISRRIYPLLPFSLSTIYSEIQ